MVLHIILAALASLSLALALWQFVVAMRFPLHQRVADKSFTPPVTLLKPLKDEDAETLHCLESWLTQDYAGSVQILFGVESATDPVCELVRRLMAAHPGREAQLVICSESLGSNAKVSTLIQLQRLTRHDLITVSDADVRVPTDLLTNMVSPLRDPAVGLVNCFYQLANPATLAMQWEAIAINADFWSQVLQSRSIKPLDFALGAVMATTRQQLEAIGGFNALVDFLADDYQLGNRVAKRGGRVVLSPVVVECWDSPKNWSEVWQHQLRWARTIRVCQPLPYFFSILGNATLWPLLWVIAAIATASETSGTTTVSGATVSVVVSLHPLSQALMVALVIWLARVLTAMRQESRLTRSHSHWAFFWLVPIKDVLNVALWALAVLGKTVEWRGQRYRIQHGGKLVKVS
ncbi:MAG: hypothetical protein DME21_04060 [Verrucomicrobia bacterium]|nr:MAG: hypothetical protein DME21_04060 [Verrucomicrobiota bacterium]